MKTTFAISGNAVLRISPAAMQTLLEFRQAKGANEAGGILIGREYASGSIVIEEASAPSLSDKAGPTWFDRSQSAAQQIVDERWQRSNGELIYIGEWHSHPEDVPRPSSRDRKMINNMLCETSMEIDFLILIIVGRTAIWVGQRTRKELLEICVQKTPS